MTRDELRTVLATVYPEAPDDKFNELLDTLDLGVKCPMESQESSSSTSKPS